MSTNCQNGVTDNTANGQFRNWTCVIYPGDSCPSDYVDILDKLHIEWVESPLHDKDVNGDGTPKKPHKHLALLFDGKKSYDQVKAICDSVGGTIPQRAHSVKALIRYFAHLDNPEKAPYRIADVVAHGGIDVASLMAPSSAERYEIVRDMMQFCIDADIYEFSDLCQYAMDNHFDTWYPVLVGHHTLAMQTFLTSRRHKYHKDSSDGQPE